MRIFIQFFGVAIALLTGAVMNGQKEEVIPFSQDIPDGCHDCFCVSRDGKKLAMNYWTIWEVTTGKKALSGKTRGAHGIAFSPDASLLAVAGNYSEFHVYNALDGTVVWDLTLIGHGNAVIDQVELTSDGRYLVSSSRSNGMLRVWNVREKKAQALFCFTSDYEERNAWREYLQGWRTLAGDKLPDAVETFKVFEKPINGLYQFSLNPDGKSIALAQGTSDLVIMELSTGNVLKTIRTEQVSNLSVRFSDDGKYLAIGGGDDRHDSGKCTIEVWDVGAEKRVSICAGHRHSVIHLAISQDKKTIVSGGTCDGIRAWDVKSGKQKFSIYQEGSTRVQGLAFLPDGRTFLSASDHKGEPIRFWNTETGKACQLPKLKKSP